MENKKKNPYASDGNKTSRLATVINECEELFTDIDRGFKSLDRALHRTPSTTALTAPTNLPEEPFSIRTRDLDKYEVTCPEEPDPFDRLVRNSFHSFSQDVIPRPPSNGIPSEEQQSTTSVAIDNNPAVIEIDCVDVFDYDTYKFTIPKSDTIEDDIPTLLANLKATCGKGNEWLSYLNKLLLNFVYCLEGSTVEEETKRGQTLVYASNIAIKVHEIIENFFLTATFANSVLQVIASMERPPKELKGTIDDWPSGFLDLYKEERSVSVSDTWKKTYNRSHVPSQKDYTLVNERYGTDIIAKFKKARTLINSVL